MWSPENSKRSTRSSGLGLVEFAATEQGLERVLTAAADDLGVRTQRGQVVVGLNGWKSCCPAVIPALFSELLFR
jgi:hypothetical protein